MYFTVKYIDFQEFESSKIQKETNDTFVVENKLLLVNPDCPIGIIRDYIASTLLLTVEDVATFELCTEKGSIVKTSQVLPAVNGLDVLKEKETYYVILATDVDIQDKTSLITPLLNKFSTEYADFMVQQKKRSSSSKLRKLFSSKSNSKEFTSAASSSRAARSTSSSLKAASETT